MIYPHEAHAPGLILSRKSESRPEDPGTMRKFLNSTTGPPVPWPMEDWEFFDIIHGKKHSGLQLLSQQQIRTQANDPAQFPLVREQCEQALRTANILFDNLIYGARRGQQPRFVLVGTNVCEQHNVIPSSSQIMKHSILLLCRHLFITPLVNEYHWQHSS